MQSSTRVFVHQRDVISKSRTIHQHLFSDFSPFCSKVKEKGKQGRMKGLTLMQWTNLNWNNRSVFAHRYSVLCEKASSILQPLVGVTAGRHEGRRNTGEFQNFKNSPQVILFGLLFCLISLQCYYSIRTTFSRLLASKTYFKMKNSEVQKFNCNIFMAILTIRYQHT